MSDTVAYILITSLFIIPIIFLIFLFVDVMYMSHANQSAIMSFPFP